MGQMAGAYLIQEGLLPEEVALWDVGFIVAAACLAHDLGNPPFGHSGEDAIQQWATNQFKDKSLLQDFSRPKNQDFLSFQGMHRVFAFWPNSRAVNGAAACA